MANQRPGANKRFIGYRGRTYRIERAINQERTICVRMYDQDGNPASARFWVWYFGIKKKKLGHHTGRVCFELSGPVYTLKVGHLELTTYFYIFYGERQAYYSHRFDLSDFP